MGMPRVCHLVLLRTERLNAYMVGLDFLDTCRIKRTLKYPCCVVLFTIANAPAISDCPSLVGPTTVNNKTQIEFYCDVNTNATDSRSRFRVSFLFNFQIDRGVPAQILDLSDLRATLHERYLAGRLNKAVRCLDFYQCVLSRVTKMHELGLPYSLQ